jgi:hypothetical protein
MDALVEGTPVPPLVEKGSAFLSFITPNTVYGRSWAGSRSVERIGE